MSRISRMLMIACLGAPAAVGLAALSATDVCAQATDKLPPPLSVARAKYFHEHPTELAAIMAKLPASRSSAGPLADPPQTAPTVGGVWKAVVNPMPASGASAPHLMMDGTVLVHSACSPNWYKLTPTAFGGYAKGTWTAIAPMPSGYTPLYFASQVLADGRLIVNGGEYLNCQDAWTPLGAIYNPDTNTWTSVPAPSGWANIGDAQSVVLFNKKYMLADCCTSSQAILNPTTMAWAPTGSGKSDENDEEGWSLLPSGNVITADAYVSGGCGKNTELYNAATKTWASAGNAAVRQSDCSPSYEVGPQVLRPDGSVVMFSGRADGAAAGTSVYASATGTQTAGAVIPASGGSNFTAKDSPGALMPNGIVLVAVSPAVSGEFPSPTKFVEYARDNTDAFITNNPPGADGYPSYVFNMLVLPTGEVMLTNGGSNQIYLYEPVGAAKAGWAPTITSAPSVIARGTSQQLSGTQLNGLSEAGAYGDDNQAATDYPLVRLTATGTGMVYFCKTTDVSSRNIAKQAATTMIFTCPTSIPAGSASLVVVTNGIASVAKAVTLN